MGVNSGYHVGPGDATPGFGFIPELTSSFGRRIIFCQPWREGGTNLDLHSLVGPERDTE